MSAVYRCKVRKPNGEITDGCGYEFSPKMPEHYSRDGMQCGACKVGFMRERLTPLASGRLTGSAPNIQDLNRGLEMAAAGRQIHGGPLVVEAHRSTQAGSPEDLDARYAVLRCIHSNARALMFLAAAATPGAPPDADAMIRETIALLQSLLPASPLRDKRAQVDMAEEHNARADRGLP